MASTEEGVSHLLLQATDIERTAEFYSEVVGFDVTERTEFGDGRPLVKFHVGMGLTELEDDRADSGQAVEHIAFEISDIDGLVASLREHDVEIDDAPKSTIYGTSVYFFDPDGNRIECHD